MHIIFETYPHNQIKYQIYIKHGYLFTDKTHCIYNIY